MWDDGLEQRDRAHMYSFYQLPFFVVEIGEVLSKRNFDIHVETMLNVKIAMCNKLNLTETQLCNSEATHSYHFSELEKRVLCGAQYIHLNQL